MVRVSRLQFPRFLTDGDALGVMDVDRVLECYNLYGRTRPLVVAHRGATSGSKLVPWPSGQRIELDMLEFDDDSNDWGMATMTGDGTDHQSRFAVPMSGWWCVSAFAGVPNPASSTHTGVWRLEICKSPRFSGVPEYEGAQIELAREDGMTLGTADTHCNLGAGTIMWCNEGEEVFARVYQTTGTDISVESPSNNSEPDCKISLVWLGVSSGQTFDAFDPASTLSAGNVPDDDDWTAIANQAFYVVDDRPTVKVGNTGSGTGVTTSTFTPLVMNSENNSQFPDLWGWHSTSSNASRITVPTGRGGLYLVGGAVAGPQNGVSMTCSRILSIRKNGTAELVRESLREAFVGAQAGPVMSVGPTLVELAASDYIEAVYWQDSGATITVGTTGSAWAQSNVHPSNMQLYCHQVQEGTMSTSTSFTENGYQACNTVLTPTWWNTYLVNNGVALVRDVRACSVIMTSAQSVGSGWVTIVWDDEEYDNMSGGFGMWNPSFSDILLPQLGQGGWYLVGATLSLSVTGATRRMAAIQILKSGTTPVAKRGITSESAGITVLNIPATLVHLTAGSEYLQLQCRHNVGSAINVGGDASANRWVGNMWALRVCSSEDFDPA